MKKLCIGLSLILLAAGTLLAQDTTAVPLPAYKSFPEVPPLKLLLTDSTTWYTKDDVPKKKQTLIVIFSPECDHCKHETEAMIANIERFKNIQVIMSSSLPIYKIKEFYQHYDLGRFKNIVVGKDISYLLPVFYNIRMLPFLAFYDKKGGLIDVFEGALPIEKVLEKFNQ